MLTPTIDGDLHADRRGLTPGSEGRHRRGRPPRSRDHRATARRTDRRTTGPPALGELRRQRRLADLRGDLPQPATRRRHAGLARARHRPWGDPAPPPRRRPGPARAPRPAPARAAPTRALALVRRLGRAVRRYPPGTPGPSGLTGPGADPTLWTTSRSTNRTLSSPNRTRRRTVSGSSTTRPQEPKRSPTRKRSPPINRWIRA
jgi:hypothetical protein